MLAKILITAIKRAFTKSNGALVPTTSPAGHWDLEATLAWLIRCLLIIFLLWFSAKVGVTFDPTLIPV